MAKISQVKVKFCALCLSERTTLVPMNKNLNRCENKAACGERLMKDPEIRSIAAVVKQLARV